MSEFSLPAEIEALSDSLPLPDRGLLCTLVRSELLDAYLQRQLQEALCAAVLGARIEPLADPAAELLAYGRRHSLETLETVDAWRAACGLSLEDLEQLVAFEQRLQQATETLWSPAVASLFLQHRADFDQVVMSIVRIDDPDLATELFFQLQEGSLSFPELVENYAQGQDRTNRGVIGPIRVQQLNPLLSRVVRRYRPGVLIPPLDVNGRVHLMRIESLQPAQLDGAVREHLLMRLRSQWLSAQLLRIRLRLLQAAAAVPEAAEQADQALAAESAVPAEVVAP